MTLLTIVDKKQVGKPKTNCPRSALMVICIIVCVKMASVVKTGEFYGLLQCCVKLLI